MKISVIIPTYNEEKTIANCLKSLKEQTVKDFEIIVVDDGSKDKTGEIVKGFPVIYLTQKHQGPGAARNLAAKKASGEILVFLDADMTFDKTFLEKLVDPILKGRVKGTFSKEEYLLNKENPWAISWNINKGLPKDRMHQSNYPEKQKVFRAVLKSEFLRAGGFNEKAGYNDDWSLSEKLGYEAVNAPGAVFYHQNPDSPKEVFLQSKWTGKRKYKLGIVGVIFALLRVSLPISLIVGFVKFVINGFPLFVIFKIVSDFGVFIGILEYGLLGKSAK
jgi:glycosyltransferase involved in cell wall biosynthesis